MSMTKKIDTLTVALPEHWLPAIVNCDPTGLDHAEYDALCRWEDDTVREFGPIAIGLPDDHGSYFARYHDAAEYGVLACMCVDVTLAFEA